MNHRHIDLRPDSQNKSKINFSINWEKLFNITIKVFLLFLIVLAIVYIKYMFDVNAYWVKNF